MGEKRTFTKKKGPSSFRKKFFDKKGPSRDGAKKSYGESKPSGDRKPFGEKKSYGGNKSFGEKKMYPDTRPSRFGDRKPSSSGSGDRRSFGAKKSYGDRKPFGAGRSFGDRKPSGDGRSFGAKKRFGEKKSFGDRKSSFSRDKKSGFKDKPAFQKKSSSRDFHARREEDLNKEYKKYDNNFKETLQPGLFQKGRSFFTRNAIPGKLYFDKEFEKTFDGVQYREVDPTRSKFVAAIAKGLQQTGLTPGAVVLYLGASHGYTPSFFSDLIAVNGKLAGKGAGMLFCLDFAPRVVRDLYFVCKSRDNMAPIMGDAAQPQTYADLVPQEVDVVYQDIAQRAQVEIFLKNCDRYLKKGGFGMVAIKARSIDVTKRPQEIFKQLRKVLEDESNGYTVIDYRELAPFEKDHAFFTIKKK